MTREEGGLLRRVLGFDAATCAVMGTALWLGAEALGQAAGMPTALLRALSPALLGFAALLGWLAAQRPAPAALVRGVVLGNLLWSAASILLVMSGVLQLTALGIALVLGQAAAVAVIAELEWLGLRRTYRATA